MYIYIYVCIDDIMEKGSDLLSAYAELDRGMKHWTEACHGDTALAGVLYRWVVIYGFKNVRMFIDVYMYVYVCIYICIRVYIYVHIYSV